MIQITVTGTEALTRRLLEIGADAPLAARRAVNRTLDSLKTATVSALAKNVGLRNKDIAPSIGLSRATNTTLSGTLTVTGRRIPLVMFGARGPEPSRGKGRGVSYRLPGGRGIVGRGFLATMPSGHRGVFVRDSVRESSKRSHGAWGPNLPIRELMGPSLPGAMVRSGILGAQLTNGDALLAKNMNREINNILRQRAPTGDE